jgi:hypothetical protein
VGARANVVAGAFFLLIGVAFGGVALYLWVDPEERQLAADGAVARAELLRKELHANRTRGALVRPEFRIHYRFDGISASASVDEAFWRRVSPGDPVEVSYLPSDRSVHRVETQQRELVLPVVFGLIGVLFAPLGFALVRRHAPFLDRCTAWISRSPAHALGTIGVAFFLCFFAAGVYWLDALRGEEALFGVRGRQAEGMVLTKAMVKKRSSSTSGSRSTETTYYHVTYRFRADSGEDVVGTSTLGFDEWQALKERAPVPVTYVAGSPWLHRIQGWEPSWWPAILFLALGGIGSAACGALAWWGRGRSSAPQKPKRPPPSHAAKPEASAGSAKSSRSWWWGLGFGAIFFFAGCGATVDGILALLEERRYAAQGKDAQARIVDKGVDEAQRGGRTRTEYVARYRFDTAEGVRGEGRAVLEVGAWEAARVGDRIAVRYVPGDPSRNRPAGEGSWAYGIIICIVGPLFALIGAFFAWGSWLARRDG